MCISAFEYLRFGQGLIPGRHPKLLSVSSAVLSARKALPSWTPQPPDAWRLPFSSSPIRGRVTFFLLLVIGFAA